MPTGYTAGVCDGKVTEFKDFALQCARGFGALITMRDDPMDAAIPTEFKPGTYHADRLAAAEAELADFQNMRPDEADRMAADDYKQRIAQKAKYDQEREERNTRVKAMLAAVEFWTPPTADHVEMKRFMVEQLTISIEQPYERDPIERLSGTQWLAGKIAAAKHDIEYHKAENAKEIERAQGRTEWLRQLRASLEPQPKAA